MEKLLLRQLLLFVQSFQLYFQYQNYQMLALVELLMMMHQMVRQPLVLLYQSHQMSLFQMVIQILQNQLV
jgi:hypothetical protein